GGPPHRAHHAGGRARRAGPWDPPDGVVASPVEVGEPPARRHRTSRSRAEPVVRSELNPPATPRGGAPDLHGRRCASTDIARCRTRTAARSPRASGPRDRLAPRRTAPRDVLE